MYYFSVRKREVFKYILVSMFFKKKGRQITNNRMLYQTITFIIITHITDENTLSIDI